MGNGVAASARVGEVTGLAAGGVSNGTAVSTVGGGSGVAVTVDTGLDVSSAGAPIIGVASVGVEVG